MADTEAERRLEPQSPRCIFCPGCGGEVYEGELLYLIGGPEGYVCGHCLVNRVSELRAEELAWLLSLGRKKVSF
jgi:hypothetical protein